MIYIYWNPILSGLYTINTIWLIYTIWIYIADCTILLLYKPPVQQRADLVLPQLNRAPQSRARGPGPRICTALS